MNQIPIIGWFISFGLSVSLAIPFYICWYCCEIGIDFFTFLPVNWQQAGFWQIVGLFVVVNIIKTVFLPAAFKRKIGGDDS